MKSHASDLLELATTVYTDAAAKCTDVTLDVRDLQTIKSRFEHEGLSFLTITLPAFGVDFERCLSVGQIETTCFRSFKKRAKAPAFLRGFLSQVFDEAGRIKHEPSIPAIEGIRQIAYTFKKLEVPCSPKRVRAALAKFVLVEHEAFSSHLAPKDLATFGQVCRVLWAPVLHNKDFLGGARPKHGPGATADKLSGNAKYLMQRWHDRLEPYFPLLDWRFTSINAYQSAEFEDVKVILEADEQPVKVITVPKTLKAPRIIAIEPCCMQYSQQGLARELINVLETHPYTSGGINFSFQWINRALAMISSSSGRLATLDLSAASDRVPYTLALSMFDSNPDLRDAIDACRSKKAQTPDGEIHTLKKFASMGSALCFPIEAMYFYTLCVMALMEKRNLPVTAPSLEKVVGDVFVYGDDIIVPVDESDVVVQTLEKYYCKVNTTKSFRQGKFRESCGMDAFDGEPVIPTYLRQEPLRDKRASKEWCVSTMDTSNQFYNKGYWRTSSLLNSFVERVVGKLPITGPRSSVLGKHSFQKSCVSADRWNMRYQRPEVRAWVVSPVYSDDAIDGYAALTKCLLSLAEGNSSSLASDKDHLIRTARHGACALKRRWVTDLN